VKYVVDYHPHEGQLLVHLSGADIKVLACGVRWGKDRATIMELLMTVFALAPMRKNKKFMIPRVLAWYVAPTFAILRQMWRELTSFVPDALIKKRNDALMTLELEGGIVIEGKSADRPTHLKGVGLDVLAITEGALVPDLAWEESLFPRLTTRGRLSKVIINSTPRGRNNWFYRIYLEGLNKNNDKIQSWNFPSWTSPYASLEWIAMAKKQMPENKFRQEIGAEFTVDGMYPFEPYVYTSFTMKRRDKKKENAVYYLGVDTGGSLDYTAIAVLEYDIGDGVFRVIDYDMFLGSPKDNVERITYAIMRWKPDKVIIEENMGGKYIAQEVTQELMQRQYFADIKTFRTTRANRDNLFESQLLWFSKDKLFHLDIQDIKDQYNYIYKDESGKYKHMSNKHDDIVIATGLALVEALEDIGQGGEIIYVS
jgi:hypothetical protein